MPSENVIFIDPERCMGCRACEIACAVEHSATKSIYSAPYESPKPMPRIKVIPVDIFTVPMRCQHCKDAPCMRVCPTKAIQRTDEGFVILNPLRCIGCLMCAMACPFGHPRYDPETKTVVKCDFCIDRLRKGLQPACVEACPTGALRFGKLEELLAEVAERKARELISGAPAPGMVVVKPIPMEKVEKKVEVVKPSDLRSMYSKVSWA